MKKPTSSLAMQQIGVTRRTAVSVLAAPLFSQTVKITFDPNFGSALAAAAAIRSRKVSSVELTRHVFERIDRFQSKVNAFVYLMGEEALASARRMDEAIARNEKLPPFAGVPIIVKESFDVSGSSKVSVGFSRSHDWALLSLVVRYFDTQLFMLACPVNYRVDPVRPAPQNGRVFSPISRGDEHKTMTGGKRRSLGQPSSLRRSHACAKRRSCRTT